MAIQQYLRLPLKLDQILEKKKLDSCTMKESIARNIHLLITTTLGENKQDLQYGALFWEYDYDIHMANDTRRDTVISSIKRQVQQYEKRLNNVAVDVNVKQAEYKAMNGRQLRRRVEITISGLIARSNEAFRFQTGFFIGPLSFD